ncbi:unnamed protein product [Ophioblennius macclurei]
MSRRPPAFSELFDPLLTEDVEEMLGRFQQLDSVRFEDFSAIWREMRFSDIFLGIDTQSEMRRFCKVALITAVKYFLPPYCYQIRVGGLYLMFALYQKQLFKPPMNIRLALRDWAHVQTFLLNSMRSGHHDAVYIYHKLVYAKAFHYTAMPQLLSFQKMRKPKKQTVCTEFLGRTTAVQDLFSASILEEVTNIQGLYETLKQATLGVGSQVAVTHRDFTSCLTDTMSEFIAWQEKKFPPQGSKKEEESSSSKRTKLLSSIKQKSYGNYQEASKHRRHRHVEVVGCQTSAPEQVQLRKRPPSLRARTWRKHGVAQEDGVFQPWTMSSVEKEEADINTMSD